MRSLLVLFLSLSFFGCQPKEEEEDPSEIDRIVLLEEEEQENSLIQAPDHGVVLKEYAPVPQEMILMEDYELPVMR